MLIIFMLISLMPPLFDFDAAIADAAIDFASLLPPLLFRRFA